MQNLVDLKIAAPPDATPEATRWQGIAESCTIESAADSVSAQEARAAINSQLLKHRASRMEITRPIDAAKAAVIKLFLPVDQMLETALRTIDRKVIEWDDAQEAARIEAQRKADAEAKAEQDRLQKLADANAAKGNTRRAEQFEERAQAVVAPVIQSETARASGVSFRPKWTYRIKDEGKLKREFLEASDKKIGAVVRSMGKDAEQLCGDGSIEVSREKSLSSRR
jgi:hypothetical protein